MEGKKKKERKRRKTNAKFSGDYVRPRTHNMRAHALLSHQFESLMVLSLSVGVRQLMMEQSEAFPSKKQVEEVMV